MIREGKEMDYIYLIASASDELSSDWWCSNGLVKL